MAHEQVEQVTPEPDASPISRVEPQDPEVAFAEVVAQLEGTDRTTVRVSCDLRLYQPKHGSYRYLPQASWKLEVLPDVAVARQMMAAFELFVSALSTWGPVEVMRRLDTTRTPATGAAEEGRR